MSDFHISFSKQLGALEQTAVSAHKRIDEMNRDIKGVLNGLTSEIKTLNERAIVVSQYVPELKILIEENQKKKGANTVLIILGSLLGSIATAGVGHFLK